MARVLVVDDDPVIRRLLELNLHLEGHEVLLAADGNDGVTVAVAEVPDVVLLDVMMPELDGFEVCRRLRAEPRTARVPVVMVSARAQTADLERGLAAGADEYVTKPFDPQVLMDLVERLASR